MQYTQPHDMSTLVTIVTNQTAPATPRLRTRLCMMRKLEALPRRPDVRRMESAALRWKSLFPHTRQCQPFRLNQTKLPKKRPRSRLPKALCNDIVVYDTQHLAPEAKDEPPDEDQPRQTCGNGDGKERLTGQDRDGGHQQDEGSPMPAHCHAGPQRQRNVGRCADGVFCRQQPLVGLVALVQMIAERGAKGSGAVVHCNRVSARAPLPVGSFPLHPFWRHTKVDSPHYGADGGQDAYPTGRGHGRHCAERAGSDQAISWAGLR